MLKNRILTLILLSMLLYSGITFAAESKVPKPARLNAEKMQSIQVISRNVLAAKHSESPNPELAQLRQRVEELRQGVEKLHMSFAPQEAVLNGPSSIDPAGDGKDSQSAGAAADNVRAKREGLKSELKGALSRSRTQRAKFAVAAESGPVHKRDLEQKAAAKLKELEDELESALQEPEDGQAAKLVALRQRLTLHRGAVNRQPDDTPTISTIVRHRN